MAYISKITPLGSSTTYDIKDSLALRTYNRTDIGISPNFDNPGVNGFFEIRTSTETTGESGTKPFNGYASFLTMKTPDNISMMQLAGGNTVGWYIRGKQSANVTLNGVAWDRLVTNSGTWDISISGNAATATKATQDASGNIITSTYVKKSGDTMTGAINTANNTWNKIGDDAQLGDINETGTIGIQGINGNTSLRFTTYNQTTKTEGFKLSWDNNNFSLGNFLIHKTGGKIIYCKDNLISTSTVKIDGTANLTTDDNISEWLKALLKQICIEYPNKADYIFKGYITPNSKLYYEICIYNTGTTDSTTKLPQYSFGTFSHWSTTHGTFGTSSYDFWRNTIIDSVNYTSYTVKKDGTGASGDWNINITGNAATATTANAVAWSNVTGKPIELGAYSGALNTNGWKTLGARTSGAKIYIAYNNNAATWNSSTYSASMVFGCNDTKGLLDCGYNTPIVTFGGSANANSTDNAPNWYFKLSGTSGATYTFPTSSKTLVATDGTGASGTWGISITGNAATATTASKLGTTTIGSARQPIYLNAGVPTAGNYTVAHLGNAGKSNMNDVGKLHSSMGMTSLADPGNTTDNPGNQTSWHHYISISYTDDPSGTNSWVTQFANKAGTTDLWMRSRSGGAITNGTAWAAPWTRVLTESNISNAIHISGLNLLPNTQTLETANGGTEVRNDTPFPWCYSRSIVGTTSNIDLSYNNIITPEPDTYYTLSYWAKASAATTIINYFHPSLVAAGYNSQGRTTTAADGNLTMDIDTTWKKYWIVYKTNSTCSGSKTVILGRLSAKDGITLYIALPKLEKGKISTDWTPNPGDGIHLYGRTGNTNILYNGGASTAADYSLVLHGNSTNGSSGIAFLSSKGNTTINYPSDRAFIQYHPYGITTYTAEGTLPTLATSGEANKLIIGVGNDSNDQVRLQTPGRTGLLHQVAASAYVIPDTGNETGTVGGTSQPVYVNGGIITAATAYSGLLTAMSWTGGTTEGPTLSITVGGTNKTAVIPSASASASGIVTTGNQVFNGKKTIKYSTRIYPQLGVSNERSQWYKIIFPYYNAETTTSAKWFMNSFDLHFGGGYSSNPSGVIHVIFYWTRAKENGAWTVNQVCAYGNGIFANKIILYYRIAEPGILYVNNAQNAYNGIWLDNLFVDDTAPSLDWSTTTIETCTAITDSTTPALSAYTKVPQTYLWTENGTALKTNNNIIPDVNNSRTLGTTDLKWNNIYATTFTGALSGNASTANKWNTDRTLTIGYKGQTVNGSADVSWSLHDILNNSGTSIGTATSWDQTDPGTYYVASSAAFTGTNNPENANTNNGIAPYRYGQLIVSRAGNGGLAQFYVSHNDSNNASYGIHFRTGWNNAYLNKWSVLLDSQNYTNWTVTKTGTGASGTWGISITGSAASCTGNAATADTWKTARTLTIGNTGKSVNGSANVSWTKAEILGSGTTSQFYRGDNTWASLTFPYGETLPSTGSTGDIFLQTGAEYYELPVGGATGRLLMKRSTTDRDVQWTNNVYVSNDVLFGAAWNDYAEYRKDNPTEEQEAGKCVYENGDGSLSLTTQRLMRGCEIISDTFGFAIGQDTDNGYNTPIASSGRVLAFPYETIEEFSKHIGWPVCSGPNGTVSIMTEEEEEKYPSRIIGTISEIPKYKEWGTGKVQVNGRIWIRIK